ncbi:peptidoglycan DD-metalloendopeptidase family protein [Sulfurimonas aquatica]|uniref:Peptidoglycan DD-metalloendopeptidase family protein n=1 Tax=Sulfurimonas aquatica TaxID=2672570 RepID=A0A975GDA5_9BACT|nr:M23 family metallopeptidase [Sulfurimonas aquatica]QSZ42531.1 peptidoglycan DD-metalloendopeptidase family protein [Sulfurimonas aquatica]
MRCLLVILTIFSSLVALDFKILDSNVENGRTALLTFEQDKTIEYKNVQLGKKRFKISKLAKDKSKYYALIPISYYEKPSDKKLIISYIKDGKKESLSTSIKVKDAKYEKEEIHVQSSKVNPQDKEVKKRISKEYHEAMKIYNTISSYNYLESKFILPIDSNITSDFGKARVYNGSLKGYHSGTDFRAKTPTPILAANDGKVVLVKKRFYSGGTVLLDHGQGIYTCYFHMSAFNVKVAQVVKKGDVLGLSGSTGRVTGPHLHFSARINGIQVDPLQLISLFNNNLL